MNSLAAGILKFKKRQESCTHANPEFVSELPVPYQDCLHCSGLMKLEFPARISVFSKIPEMNGERDYQDLRSLYKSVVTNFLQSGHKSGTACIVAPVFCNGAAWVYGG